MKRFKFQNLFLLGYLVLFLNFGPSFHRASFFGLHDHGSADHQTEFVCSCGHHHAPIPKSDNEPTDFSIEKPLCDCAFCKFFKQYNASMDLADLSIAKNSLILKQETIESLVSRNVIATDARGPPIA